MSYPIKNVLDKEYKDPDKLEEILNTTIGEGKWGSIEASIVFIQTQ